MSTPGQDPQTPKGHYGEISPGVPRYGQYAPEGYVPPSAVPPPPANPGHPGAGHHGNFADSPGESRIVAAPPKQVVLAFRLLLAAGLINTILTVLSTAVLMTAAGRSTALEVMAQMGVQDTSIIEPALITAIALGFISTGIYALIAFQIRKGRNWARITGGILAAISLVSLLSPNVITLVQVALGLAAMVILFREPAASFFRQHGGARIG